MENTNEILARNINRYRTQYGITQEELASRLGVTYQAVSKWENAKAAPDISFLPDMAEIFGCSIDELFDYIPQKEVLSLNVLPGDDLWKDGVGEYVARQIRYQLDNSGSTNKFIEVMLENLEGEFELTDKNIERLLDAYREMYRGIRKKK